MSDAPSQSSTSSKGIFKRLLRMLRPHWPTIGVAVVLLLLSMPAELFPGLTWMYVTDTLIVGHPTRWSNLLGNLFSFNGRITGNLHLLYSAVLWMFAVYLFS